MYRETQSLADYQTQVLSEIVAQSEPQSAAMRVFQNNYLYGLIDVLTAAYPLTFELLGKGSFEAFAHDHVRQFALQTGNRNDYGRHFGDLLDGHDALKSVPWMADFARFEWAAHVAHHADDATPCTPDQLMDMATHIGIHPSVSLLALCHAVSTLYFAQLVGMEAPAPEQNATHILVGRDQANAIFCLPLSALSQQFLEIIIATGSMAQALDQLNPTTDEMADLQQFLGHCLQDGVLIPLNFND